jgi:3-hydroxyacyl-CoA dehydrogenase
MDAGPEGADRVRYETRDGVAVLTVASPPVNALVQPVRAALLDAVTRAQDDPEAQAILIRADGRTFPTGADVREFSATFGAPTLADLCLHIEACPKPVIAAIHGAALGGGLELALACHYRLAHEDARLGFPEVTLGVVPNAGGTQRLPRLVGAKVALDMLTTGKPLDAERAQAAGLVDKVVERNLERAGFGTARNFGHDGTPPRPTRDVTRGTRDARGYLEVIAARRRHADKQGEAVPRLVDLVEAALLVPFETGLDMEHAAYEDLVNSDTSRGLRHAFLAERRAARVPALAGVDPLPVHAVGVIGAGPLARDVAMAALAAGVPVTVALEDDPAISRVRTRIERSLGAAVEAGRLSGRARDTRLSRLKVSQDLRALGDADVIIDALPEDAVRKAHVLLQVGGIAKPGAVIASSTADCDLETLVQSAARRDRFAAMHFIAPADRNRLVEIAPVRGTAPAATATLIRLARAMGKMPIVAEPRAGLVFNRLVTAYYSAAALTLERGASPQAVDRAMRDLGMPLGPFEAQDVAGLDAVWGLRAEECPSAIPVQMLENAWYGRRSGQGFYVYEGEDRVATGEVSRELDQMLRGLRAEAGVSATGMKPDEIRKRCLFALANEGAKLVEAGVVARPSDVDVVMLQGLGFPRAAGGPMRLADREGSLAVRAALRAWAEENDFWTPAPLWDRLVSTGRRFEDMNLR